MSSELTWIENCGQAVGYGRYLVLRADGKIDIFLVTDSESFSEFVTHFLPPKDLRAAIKMPPVKPKPKPCPACGETPIAPRDPLGFWVECLFRVPCGFRGPKAITQEEAIKSWNRLTMEPENA